MDFFQIGTKEVRGKEGVVEIFPDFKVGRSKDIMFRGRAFYAIWDEEQGLWSTDEYVVQQLVDKALDEHAEKLRAKGMQCTVKYLGSFSSNSWNQFQKFMKNLSDNSHELDQKLTFADTPVKKTDYASRRLPYSLSSGDHSTWDRLLDRLYSPEERAKIEWTIGSIVSGDSKKIQKFLVLYGPGGTGKSTVLNIVEKLFEGYITTFEAKALVGNNNSFSTEAFKHNPLVAIQHDGDLSKIDDNSKLNSIVGHDTMLINEKYKAGYTTRINAMLLMGTNKPVKITDAKSGLIRRLIDAHPTGNLFTPKEYSLLINKVEFELGAIAQHCLDVYKNMGRTYFNAYRPVQMMLQTDVFYNYIEYYYDLFSEQDGGSLRQAYDLYKEFCKVTGVDWVLPQYKFREELRNYFEDFHDRITIDGESKRSYYTGFRPLRTKTPDKVDEKIFTLELNSEVSILDKLFAEQPAQYANAKENPAKYWTDSERVIDGETKKPKASQVVSTILSDLDTKKLHFVKVPPKHIVIDFDLKDDSGAKSLERNLEAASSWPATYAELSKSGSGVHLHYHYDGDTSELSNQYSDGIEVKVYVGDSALRRRLSKCNTLLVAAISSGLPLKEKKVLSVEAIKSEKGLRSMIVRNLQKEFHSGTKSSVDFINKILEDAYNSGMPYDVSDMKSNIMSFAMGSTNHHLECMRTVKNMKFKSEESQLGSAFIPTPKPKDKRLVFFDCEVYPNLFLICWKYQGSPTVTPMINPTPQQIEDLFRLKLIGFNNRKYDNHMLWAAYLGYTNQALYELSKKIIETKDKSTANNFLFGEAYGLSFADVLDFSSIKQSLKKFQVQLGLKHKEMDQSKVSFDEPVPDDRLQDVIDYCSNDVETLEEVFEDRKQDYAARAILADLSGLTINDTTNKHSARIIFGDERDPHSHLVYTKLARDFPGYVFEGGVSTYKGLEVGEGGFVDALVGFHEDVAVLDVASMHPTSAIELNAFGQYTDRFKQLLEARLAIKHKDWASAKKMLDGKLTRYVEDIEKLEDPQAQKTAAKQLSDALKIVINSVYGLTSAKFENPFRHKLNADNIVAKRGALFMIDLKEFVESRGFEVAHIKTDSIKIPRATAEIITEVMEFGKKYGYTFEHEETYDKFCLVNKAVYIAKHGSVWSATGAQFQHPYVFKALFTREPFTFDDYCEVKEVKQGHIYMDFESVKPMGMTEGDVPMTFVGRFGRFVPVKEGYGGAILYRVQDGKNYAVGGTKGYFWVDEDRARALGEEAIDMRYFETLAEKARDEIEKYTGFGEFVS